MEWWKTKKVFIFQKKFFLKQEDLGKYFACSIILIFSFDFFLIEKIFSIKFDILKLFSFFWTEVFLFHLKVSTFSEKWSSYGLSLTSFQTVFFSFFLFFLKEKNKKKGQSCPSNFSFGEKLYSKKVFMYCLIEAFKYSLFVEFFYLFSWEICHKFLTFSVFCKFIHCFWFFFGPFVLPG